MKSNCRISRKKRIELKKARNASRKKIREENQKNGATIISRTQASNSKFPAKTVEEECIFRETLAGTQIQIWRSMLPKLLLKLSQIPDPRRPKSIKHKINTLLIFGLLISILKLKSRREMNSTLSRPLLYQTLQSIFPELDSIPHSDTLARLLEQTDPKEIEKIHVSLLKDLIKKRKFKKLLIYGCLPITFDGTQKFKRNGFLLDDRCLERTIHSESGDRIQQYVYVLEANITLYNGLTIPLLSEFTAYDPEQENKKQDCELNAFHRLSKRLKSYFPRLKIILFLDKLFANQGVFERLNDYNWEFMIALPANKLKKVAKQLAEAAGNRREIPRQNHWRSRHQKFYYKNNIEMNYGFTIHAVGCNEDWREVNNNTGKVRPMYSTHTWISSIPLNLENLHELCNLGARKRFAIEDSMNTEKHRGYYYEHAFSYNWQAMRCFHHLMRLGHAINALSEFTKKLKKYIKKLGVSVVFNLIKETLSNPWLSKEWFDKELKKTPQLRLFME